MTAPMRSYAQMLALLQAQDQCATRAQLLQAGASDEVITRRLRAREWQRPLPSIYVATAGELTSHQRRRCALLHAGEGAMLTAGDACQLFGLRYVPAPPRNPSSNGRDALVVVLADRTGHARSAGFVQVVRTGRLPKTRLLRDGLDCAPAVRAVADACRLSSDLRAVRAILAEAVQRRLTTPDALLEECEAGPQRGSGLMREALGAVLRGAWSGPEGELLDGLATSTVLPPAVANVLVRDAFGVVLGRPDAAFEDVRLALEVDSAEHHALGPDWAATLGRHNRFTAAGWTVLHFTPAEIRNDLAGVIARVEQTYLMLRAARHSA